MATYKVINLSFQISDNFYLAWHQFSAQKREKKHFTITILSDIDNIHGVEYTEIKNGYTYFLRRNSDIMLVDKSWENSIVLPVTYSSNIFVFSCQLFYTHAVQRHIIYLHSSLIAYRCCGLMFLGPSGIGNTTQAELWNQYRDALIINGDVVFIQETSNAFLGWGTPWHGSSSYCENTNVPVKALVVLKQASDNSIRELSGFEKVTAVSNSVFYPRWLQGGTELCLETLNHLLTALPVYELSCRPDEEAVRLVEDAVFGKTC